MNAPSFKNRWLIKGSLTTESELHVGDGGAGGLGCRNKAAEGDEADASTVCTDVEGKAFLPGSGIKGTLRALVSDANGIIDGGWACLLGSDRPDDPDAVGGKLEFWDAFHSSGAGTEDEEPDSGQPYEAPDRKRPWWDNTRRTCVAVAVSLDRRTRTAEENLLYHLEYVPKDETFEIEISGDNLEPEEVAHLLWLLEQFNATAHRRATLGALSSNGWGQVTWKEKEILCLDDIDAWKKKPTVGLRALPRVRDDDARKIEEIKRQVSPATSGPQRMVIEVALTMESPWLIRDPRQDERKEAGKSLKDEKDKPKDAVAILDESGAPFVPAKSFRGALRSRAEMILRTLGLKCDDHPSKTKPLSTKRRSVTEVLKEIAGKDLASKLFGLSGWRAPLDVPRLIATDRPKEHDQEFVAIDRFTGGAAAGAKFNAELAGMTTLTGKLTVDLDRLEKVDPGCASIGLLALVLRDLEEGDITIGSGAAKGQGFCTATIKIDGADWRTHDLIAKGIKALRKPSHP